MRLIRIGVAAVSVKVGDFKGNRERLQAIVREASEQQVHLLVTPELCISGYSLEDRVFWPDIAEHSWESLQELAESCVGLTAFVGLPIRIDSMMYNATALIHDRVVRGMILKRFLPTYSIFYEGRNWTPWHGGTTEYHGTPVGDLVFRLPYGMVSAEICEDMWSPNSPAHARVLAGAEIICNGSASPFTPRKNEHRKRLIQGAAGGLACVYAYANLLGCDNSRLVFDGGGIIATPEAILAEGRLLAKSKHTLTTAVVDIDDIARVRAENTTWRQAAAVRENGEGIKIIPVAGDYQPASVGAFAAQMPRSFFFVEPLTPSDEAKLFLDELFDALVLGLRDYFEKVGAFKRFLIALSGGRDSALCLLLAVHAVKAMGKERGESSVADRVSTVYLPNKAYSSSATENAARALAKELSAPFQVVSIAEEAEVALAKAAELVGGIDNVTPLARQNLQARVRGNMMLNWANSMQGLLLVTSNLSEAAVGYTTTGGDNQGGYSPIANLPKTLVTRLVAHIAERDKVRSLQDVLAIPPSAELAPDQEDEKDLMPYVILDDLLYLFARRRLALTDCWRLLCHRHSEHTPATLKEWTARFGKLFAHNQWKREQLPVTLKVLDLDLDPKTGFRFPVTQSIDHELDALTRAEL